MSGSIARFNTRLERLVIDTGETVRILSGWLPVQARRALRLIAMGVLAYVAGDWLGLDSDAKSVGTVIGTALQEVVHRSAAPATPDREAGAE